MTKLTLARNAMATRFEMVLVGSDPVSLRGAGEEALDEIERIESLLSIFKPGSEISQVNAFAAQEPVRVSPLVFSLLRKAWELWRLTEGAFDITIAPLVKCWGFTYGSGAIPREEAISEARERVGMQFVRLEEESSTVLFQRPGMMLDLGSIGKGFAIDLAAEILKDAGVQDWFIQGGTSTIYATGTDAEKQPWRVCVTAPQLEIHQEAAEPIAAPSLDGRALSVSAVSGKYFRHDGQVFGHVIDPRTGWPGTNAAMAAVLYPNAAESDALSTAVLLAKPEELDALAIKLPLPFGFLQAPFPGKASIIQHNFPVLHRETIWAE